MTSVLITTLLLLGNAFFVGAEFALIASRRTVLEPMARDSRLAGWALSAMNQIPLMIAGAQLGITICGLGLGALAEPAIAHFLEKPFAAIGIPEGAVHPTAFVIALAIVVFLHTVIGEMVPKNITLAGPEASVLWLGPPMLAFCIATKPLLLAMKWASRAVLRLWRIEAADAVKTVFTAEELAGLVSQARTEGLLDPEQHARITGALALHQRTAADALRPWSEVSTVSEDTSPASLEVLAMRTGRSRFPVIQRATRQVIGFVHVKDVLGLHGQARREPIPRRLIRSLVVVPPDRSLAELLLAMRRERRHMALVVDPQQHTPVGVSTLDDVLNAIMTG
ncbi:hemolysin family protein [Allorhizocola rhizosphaerae]|uniref:hemolysin family protein n=1 Tax=Allorhizocola rhizosphaerae TaxID=1872709 RepID=UPI000E3B9AF7|nr:hemolysin family protein [Allorhizocola rhizosphaerae]